MKSCHLSLVLVFTVVGLSSAFSSLISPDNPSLAGVIQSVLGGGLPGGIVPNPSNPGNSVPLGPKLATSGVRRYHYIPNPPKIFFSGCAPYHHLGGVGGETYNSDFNTGSRFENGDSIRKGYVYKAGHGFGRGCENGFGNPQCADDTFNQPKPYYHTVGSPRNPTGYAN